jgi:hypothetical protein
MLEEYLRDPQGALNAVLGGLRGGLATWGPVAIPALLLVLTVLIVARQWWRRCCRRALADGARIIRILPPPDVEPAGAAALWSYLVGLLRPSWRRSLSGQPHVAWEYVFDRDTVRIQLWIPGGIPPGMVERAVEAAWPGARTRTHPAPAPRPRPR